MNQPNEELEKELASLKPSAPSEFLKTQIENDLRQSVAVPTSEPIPFLRLLALGAAACVALVSIFYFANRPTAGTAESSLVGNLQNQNAALNDLSDYEPVEAEHRLLEAIDEGVVLTDTNEPVRKLRYQFIDSVTLVNETDGSVFTMEIPREEILFVPVSML